MMLDRTDVLGLFGRYAAASGLAFSMVLMAGGEGWPQAAPPSLGVQPPAQQSVPNQAAPRQAEPPSPPPVASFTVACSGLSCSFTDRSTDSGGRIVSRSWDFGDGRSGTGTQWTHTYYQGGTYTARLTITDDASRTASASQSVTAGTTSSQPPVARPGGPYSADSVVVFDGRSSSDTNGFALTYAWDFGDGHTGTGATWAHTYNVAGTYTVTLVVTNSQGVASAPATTTATITKP